MLIAKHNDKVDVHADIWNESVQSFMSIKKRRQQGYLKDDSLQQQSIQGLQYC